MVKMIRDPSGRFAERPYFASGELDRACEVIVRRFHRKRGEDDRVNLTTDEISILIEGEDADLDSSVDLTPYGHDVEGVSIFHPNGSAEVKISSRLADNTRMENRLRTTLAHEFGHLHFHRHLWAMKFATQDLFTSSKVTDNAAICKRDQILNARQADWMEWQAGYISGAILMPVSAITSIVAKYRADQNLMGSISPISSHALQLSEEVRAAFQVSEDAASVRMQVLGLLEGTGSATTLFT